MFSRALIPKLSVLDFRVLTGQSNYKVCLCKICWQPLNDAVVCSNILQIRETGFTSRAPLFEKSKLLNGRF
jgi:hypothetical protein